jgi:hypothetical protein
VAGGGTSRRCGSGERGDARRWAEMEGEGVGKPPLPTRKPAGTTVRPEEHPSGRSTVAAGELGWRSAHVIAHHAGKEGGACGRVEVGGGVRGRRVKGVK